MELLQKTKSARQHNMNTYKYHHQINQNDDDDIVISKLKNYKKPVIVKIQNENTPFIKRELPILHLLHNYKNTAKYICDFSCIDEERRWIKPIKHHVTLCNGVKEPMRFIIMEYIENGDIEPFLTTTQNIPALQSFFIQSACVIFELAEKYKITHGDLHSGNILLKTATNKTATYEIQDTTYRIQTHGKIPIIIDFGRARLETRKIAFTHIMEDITVLFHIYLSYIKQNEHIPQIIIDNIKDFIFTKKHKKEVVRTIENLFRDRSDA